MIYSFFKSQRYMKQVVASSKHKKLSKKTTSLPIDEFSLYRALK
jgi:hypothetical protein